MTDEKDKQRRISKMVMETKDRYRLEKRVDEVRRLQMTAHPSERPEREEIILREWHPDVFTSQSSIANFRTVRARHRPEIERMAKAFLDYHPIDEQRTPQAIKAWSEQHLIDASDQKELVSIAVRLAITMTTDTETSSQKERGQALIQASRDRMTEARQKAAVYDGNLDRARPAYHVGLGWYQILDDLVKDFADIYGLGFLSAHEKWGGLKVAYLYEGDRQVEVDAFVKRAADRSLTTCWYCGSAGKSRQERWWRVRCEEHWSAE